MNDTHTPLLLVVALAVYLAACFVAVGLLARVVARADARLLHEAEEGRLLR